MANADTLFSVSGRVALISGASSGIGAYIAKGLTEHGCARVYIVGRREAALKAVASAAPSILIPLVGDVSTKTGCIQVAEQFRSMEEAVTGSIALDILVNNAGIAAKEGWWDEENSTPENISDALLYTSDEDWAKVFAVNVSSIQWLSAALLPYLERASKQNEGFREGRGCIINNTSVSAFYVNKASKGHVYAASKAAAEHLSLNLTNKFTSMGVRVNSIAPANIPSEINDLANPNSFIAQSGHGAFIPIGRIGNEEDVVGATVYLASRAGSFVSGTVIKIDGGILLSK